MKAEGPERSPGDSPVRRYVLTLAYEGTGFHGWQKQANPDGPVRTVQGELDAALVQVLRQPVSTLGASRTDAGVHAMGQVVQFDAATPLPVERMAMAINSRLPEDVRVVGAAVAPRPDFRCISEPVWKRYRYRVDDSGRPVLWRRRWVHVVRSRLDVERMNDAAGRLVGTIDMAGLAAAGHGRATTVRTVHQCEVVRVGAAGDEEGEAGEDAAGRSGGGGGSGEVHVVVRGDGFLWNTVRIIAGTLVDVGLGRLEPGVVDEVLATGDRRRAGPTLPPQGLWLERIAYAGGEPS